MQNHGAYGGTPRIVVQSQYEYVERMESSIVSVLVPGLGQLSSVSRSVNG